MVAARYMFEDHRVHFVFASRKFNPKGVRAHDSVFLATRVVVTVVKRQIRVARRHTIDGGINDGFGRVKLRCDHERTFGEDNVANSDIGGGEHPEACTGNIIDAEESRRRKGIRAAVEVRRGQDLFLRAKGEANLRRPVLKLVFFQERQPCHQKSLSFVPAFCGNELEGHGRENDSRVG